MFMIREKQPERGVYYINLHINLQELINAEGVEGTIFTITAEKKITIPNQNP